MDHRWGKREPVDLEVWLACGPHLLTIGRLENVSISGALVRADLRVPLLSQVRVIARVRTANGTERFEAPAFVARHTTDGMGLEWLDLAPAMVSALVDRPRDVARAAMQPQPVSQPVTF